jgi:hypothetical protein
MCGLRSSEACDRRARGIRVQQAADPSLVRSIITGSNAPRDANGSGVGIRLPSATVTAARYYRPVQDYAQAWTAERGRCHRFVYEEPDGRPTNCPEPPAMTGWRTDGQRRWYVVDSCERHASQLSRQPRRL